MKMTTSVLQLMLPLCKRYNLLRFIHPCFPNVDVFQLTEISMQASIQIPWVSYQTRKIAGCARAANAGNVFPATDFKSNR